MSLGHGNTDHPENTFQQPHVLRTQTILLPGKASPVHRSLSSLAVPSERLFPLFYPSWPYIEGQQEILENFSLGFQYFTAQTSGMAIPKFCWVGCAIFSLCLEENWEYEWEALIFYHRWCHPLLERIFIHIHSLQGCKESWAILI